MTYISGHFTSPSAALILSIASGLCFVITVIKTSLAVSKFSDHVYCLKNPSLSTCGRRLCLPSVENMHTPGYLAFINSPGSKIQCAELSVELTLFIHRTILLPIHTITARKSLYHLGNSLQLSFTLSFALGIVFCNSSDQPCKSFFYFFLFSFFVVLFVSVGQVRAHALRMMPRLENRLSGLQRRLIWSLWHLRMDLQYLGSLPIQLMVQYGRASLLVPTLSF